MTRRLSESIEFYTEYFSGMNTRKTESRKRTLLAEPLISSQKMFFVWLLCSFLALQQVSGVHFDERTNRIYPASAGNRRTSANFGDNGNGGRHMRKNKSVKVFFQTGVSQIILLLLNFKGIIPKNQILWVIEFVTRRCQYYFTCEV